MLTTTVLLSAFVAIGLYSRKYSRRTRLLMLGSILVGIVVLMRGQ
jgi:hypothetical protein